MNRNLKKRNLTYRTHKRIKEIELYYVQFLKQHPIK